MSRKDDIKRLISNHKRRLNVLKKQHTALGIHAPPHIIIEIQDIEKQITQLGGTIRPYKPGKVTKKPERVATCPQCKSPIKLAPRNRDDESPFTVYSVRVDTSIECGHCGTIIPNQFTEEERIEVARPEAVEVAKPETVEDVKEVAVTSTKKSFSWFSKIFRNRD